MAERVGTTRDSAAVGKRILRFVPAVLAVLLVVCLATSWGSVWFLFKYEKLSYTDAQEFIAGEDIGIHLYAEKRGGGDFTELEARAAQEDYARRPLFRTRFAGLFGTEFASFPATCHSCDSGDHDCCAGSRTYYSGRVQVAEARCSCPVCFPKRR